MEEGEVRDRNIDPRYIKDSVGSQRSINPAWPERCLCVCVCVFCLLKEEIPE